MTSYLHPSATAGVRPDGQRGVFARQPIPAGTLVTLWEGSLVHIDAFDGVAPSRRPYFIHVEREWLLGPASGPIHDSEFFNHCCDPTCGMAGQIGLVTRRDVAVGEELTFDYAMAELEAQLWSCACGTRACRGQVGTADILRGDLAERYAGFLSPWIQREVDAHRAGRGDR